MTLEELAAVGEDIRRFAFCQAILEAEGEFAVEVKIRGGDEPPLVLTSTEVKPIAQQVQQRVIARLQGQGVTIPGVGT